MDWKFWSRNNKEEVRSYGNGLVSTFFDYNPYQVRNNAMGLSAVYRATEIISDSIAILPIKIKINNQNHKEELSNHPLNLIFSDKNGGIISKYNLIKLLIQSVLLRGNGFAYIQRANDGTVINIRFLESSDVTIQYNKQKNELFYLSNVIGSRRIEPINMIHLLKNSYDGVNGVSVISYASRTLNISNYTEESSKDFYEKGMNLKGIIKFNSVRNYNQENDFRNQWVEANKMGNSGIAVIPHDVTFQPISVNASDAQLIETRGFNLQEIARFFGISPILLGDLSHSGYNSIEATQQQFLINTLQPYITMLESEFNRKLLKPSEANLSINLDETYLLRTDKTAQASYYNTLLSSGVLCINEVRREMGLSPIEGGDKHIIAYSKIEDNTINQTSETSDELSQQ